MMMLTAKQIRRLLEMCGEETVVAPSKSFPYKISCRTHGYSDDKELGALQATLSIMLEVASKREA
jgi:hypothetical protein